MDFIQCDRAGGSSSAEAYGNGAAAFDQSSAANVPGHLQTAAERNAFLSTVKLSSNGEFLGSGTIVGKHGDTFQLLTASHVTNAADGPITATLPNGKTVTAHIQAQGSLKFGEPDVAILKFDAHGLTNADIHVAQIGHAKMRAGDQVFSVGYTEEHAPGLDRGTHDSMFAVSRGKFNALIDQQKTPVLGEYNLVTSTNIRPGMSGGGAFNGDGELIGIDGLYNVSHLPDVFFSHGNSNASVPSGSNTAAVSANEIEQFLRDHHVRLA